MLNITSGKVVRAQKVTIYGAEGIGKTTLAAAFPDPVFIDTEGGTSHMDVRRIEIPANWESPPRVNIPKIHPLSSTRRTFSPAGC